MGAGEGGGEPEAEKVSCPSHSKLFPRLGFEFRSYDLMPSAIFIKLKLHLDN